MGLKRKLVIAALAIGSFAAASGGGVTAAGADSYLAPGIVPGQTPPNLISRAQYDMLWEGMTVPAVEAFLAKKLTLTDQGTAMFDEDVSANYEMWAWDATFGTCVQDTYFFFVDADAYGHPYPSMQLAFWGQYQSPECDGIVK